MAKQVINLGIAANDGTGDPLRIGAQKINENFTELYSFLGNPETGQLSMVSSLKSGQGISVNSPSGVVTISTRLATTAAVGSVKVDGTSITVSEDGTISSIRSIDTNKLVSGDQELLLDTDGNLRMPLGLGGTTNLICPENAYPIMLSYGALDHGGPEFSWLASNTIFDYNNELTNRNSMWINSFGVAISLNANSPTSSTNWFFSTDGNLTLPVGGSILDSDGNSVLTSTYTLPASTTTVLGGVKVDGTTIQSVDGVISVIGGPGGTSYDQSLNTTDNVEFNSVLVAGTVTAENFVSSAAGIPTITSATNINLTAANAVVVTTSPFRLANLTTAQRNALSPVNGDMIYNTDDNKFQGFQNGVWINLDGTV